MYHNDWIPIRRLFLFSVLIIFTIIGGSLYFHIQEDNLEIYNQAKKDAESSYNKDLVYRKWASNHGGVYAPVSDITQPNPFLSHIIDRDITTPSGKHLTLINPAYMTRQVHEIQEMQYGVKGHITSLNPIRPGNKPDAWEKKALESFTTGTKEFYEISNIGNEKYLRFMRPMLTEKSCLKCHAKQGYKEGDIRGGISTSVPMSQYQIRLESSIYAHYFSHGIIGFCFLLFFIFSYYKLKKEVLIRHKSQIELTVSNKELNENQKKLLEINEELSFSKKQTEESEQRLKIQNEEYLSLNKELSESNARIYNINKALIASKEKAEESDRLKSAFLANVSHEIRTPMNGIIGFSELLQKKELSKEKQKLYSEIIKNNSLQLLDIVNDILDISKIEAGQMIIQNESINLNKFISEIFLFFEQKISDKKIILCIPDEYKDNKLTILTDPQKLRQILYNLLSNAIKFTPKGIIQIGYSVLTDEIEFFVKDSGIGIEKQFQEKIFERFGQVETELSTNKGGTGLGLSITKGLTELLGGKIRVESEINKGSIFYVKIPLQLAEIKTIDDQLKTPSFSFIKEAKILIAEDDDRNYFYLEELLQNEKLTIIRAVNGEEAVSICTSDLNISLVLMDIKMPKMNGFDATRLIKEIRPDLPIIAQTAFATVEDRNKAHQAGCNDYVSKPINTEKFNEMLKKYLN